METTGIVVVDFFVVVVDFFIVDGGTIALTTGGEVVLVGKCIKMENERKEKCGKIGVSYHVFYFMLIPDNILYM